MSLWNKCLSEVDYTDLDEFCRLACPEGLRLDYKRQIPRDLANLVSAFANTRGGLILLGVDADKTTNQPKWPCGGMDFDAGLSERITQICKDAVYPPVMPELSAPIEDPSDSSKAYMVVRIDESIRAPHSIQNGTKVYTRTGDVNKPIDLMNVDRIALLLERRKEPGQFREQLLSRQLDRCDAFIGTAHPMFWWMVSPEFPHDAICIAENASKEFTLVVADGLPMATGPTTNRGLRQPRTLTQKTWWRRQRSTAICFSQGSLLAEKSTPCPAGTLRFKLAEC